FGLSRVPFFFSSRRRHTSFSRDWSSDVCSSDLALRRGGRPGRGAARPAGDPYRAPAAGLAGALPSGHRPAVGRAPACPAGSVPAPRRRTGPAAADPIAGSPGELGGTLPPRGPDRGTAADRGARSL